MVRAMKTLRRARIATVLLICLLLTACIDARPIEDQAIVIVIGADCNQQNPSLIDLTIGVPLFDESKSSFARITTSSGVNYGQAGDNWQRGSALELATGKIRLLLFGEEMALNGLPAFINYIQAARVDDNAAVAVARGRAEDILQGRLVETERIGTNISNMLETLDRTGLSFRPEATNLITDFIMAGQDPILPLLELSAGEDVVSLVGSALFNDLNMVGEINAEETQLLLAMRGRSPEVTFAPILGPTAELGNPPPHIRLRGPRAKLSPRLENGQLVVGVDFQARYNLRQYYSVVNVIEQEEQITADLESNLTLAIQQLLAKLQAVKTDPLGIGNKYRVKNNKTYDDNQFRDLWAKARLEVQVDLEFVRAGTSIQVERVKP